MPEDAVELVEIALVLHQRRARQVIEILDLARGKIRLHRLHQRQIFAQRHRHAGGFEFLEEGDEHCFPVMTGHSRSKNGVASLAYVPATSLRKAVRP